MFGIDVLKTTEMKFNHATPILYSGNIIRSIQYYTEVLGFENSWKWGDPPSFGGVSKTSVEIFFCENGQGNPGTWLSIFVENVDELYETVKSKGANIISPPENMPWGIREMLVEDPDGHRLRFGHGVHTRDPNQAEQLPANIKIIHRTPTAAQYATLLTAVGWSSSPAATIDERLLSAPVFSVVAEDSNTGNTIGCALLLGDDVSFYYVKDVMVHPDWQHKHVGSALMQALTDWLDNKGSRGALVGLYTGDGFRSFYEKFGFSPAFGMSRRLART